ncbi:sulfatase-like hydrolase/transferase [Clostridium butyricum]|uniref:sulfatase-like hydrolase/transferase n=1 Tax=Clostridium butyricum TaxID=1492 RepID=UPI00374E2B6F
MDIDLMLNELLKKYELNKIDEVSYVVKCTREHIKRQWNDIPDKERIAIWGAGGHTEALLKLVDTSKKNLVCIIDKNSELWGKEIEGINIISKDEIKKYKIDIVVISTMSYIDEIKNEIIDLGYRYLDFYKKISLLNGTMFPWQDNVKFSFEHKYINLFNLKKSYEKEKDEKIRESLLRNLIIEYLYIRDIVNGKKCIYKYIENDFKNSNLYKKFLLELDTFLQKIKQKIKYRQNNDFIFMICDALRYDYVEKARNGKNNFKFLENMANNSVYYMNAYSNSTYTRASFKSMFEEKLIIDDKCIEDKQYSLNINNSRLIKELKEKKYEIINNSIFTITDNESEKSEIKKKDFKACSEQLWNMIKELCKNDNNTFTINHFVESHIPYVGGFHTDMIIIYPNDIEVTNLQRKKLEIQIEESIRYLDEQMRFYNEFFPENCYKIITSDHGQSSFEKDQINNNIFSACEYNIKTPLCISKKGLKNQITYELFDKINLSSLIINLIRKDKIKKFNVDFVNIQRDSIYNNKLIDSCYINTITIKYTKAFKVIKTLNEKYILYEDGKEELYIMPNESINQINNPMYIEKLKNIKSYLKNRNF